MVGMRVAARAAASRLDLLARSRLPEVWDEALTRTFGDDPAVYVIRRLVARAHLTVGPGATDLGLARDWGRSLAAAVVRVVAKEPDAENLVRFSGQAEFVACFVIELFRGQAWDRWYFEPFLRWKIGSRADTVRAVLLANREHIAEILRRLRAAGALEPLFRDLDESTLGQLWSSEHPGADSARAPAPDPASCRPIFAAALDLADRIGLWNVSGADREGLFAAFLESRPTTPDWRDRRGLAIAVLSALAFLARDGRLRSLGVSHHERLGDALRGLDWLDVDWIRDTLMNSAATSALASPRAARSGPTPRQRGLLDELSAALKDPSLSLDRDLRAGPANALRIYAALLAIAPNRADDAGAMTMIARLLEAWAAVAHAPDHVELLRRLAQGNTSGAIAVLPEADRRSAHGPLAFIAALGSPGSDALAHLVLPMHRDAVGSAAGTAVIETAAAGVFLLTRVLLDVRFPSLVRSTDFPGDEPKERLPRWLAALAIRWSGEAAFQRGALDPGLAFLVGHDRPTNSIDLVANWPVSDTGAEALFQARLVRTLGGLRRLAARALSLHVIPFGGRLALIGGDDALQTWPLGVLLDQPGDVACIVAGWLAVWSEATGAVVSEARSVLSRDDTLNDALRSAGISVVAADESSPVVPHSAFASLGESFGADARLPLTVNLTALALLRAWAAWLRRFSASTSPYLLDQFIRRPGRLIVNRDEVLVELEPGPLDVILEMSGYLSEIDHVSWLNRKMSFKLRRE